MLHRDVIQRAVRLHVNDGAAQIAHHASSRSICRYTVSAMASGAHGHLQASEILAVGIARMRADAYAALQRQARGALHGRLVPGVAAAGDVGGRDVLHQRSLVRRVLQFPHVAIQIDVS